MILKLQLIHWADFTKSTILNPDFIFTTKIVDNSRHNNFSRGCQFTIFARFIGT